MGKTKKKKHYSKKRHASGSTDNGSSSESSSSEFTENVAQLKTIGEYINDRAEMVEQMFQALMPGDHLEAVMPEILKSLPLDELKRMCVDELEGMSKKRIRCIIAGEDMNSSSGTEESSEEEEEPVAAPVSIQPVPVVAVDEASTECQQPDSTSAEPETQQGHESNPDASNDNDFGLDEPLVDIVLEEPAQSPVGKGQAKGDVETGESDGGNSESGDGQERDAEERIAEKDDGESDESSEESSSGSEIDADQDDLDLEEGEIPPKRKKKEEMVDVPTTDSADKEPMEKENSDGTEKECDAEEEIDHDDAGSVQEVEDYDDILMAEVQAQDEILFGLSTMASSSKKGKDEELMKEPLEFLEEPISKSIPEKAQLSASASMETTESFSWTQQASVKPKIGDQVEEEEKETENPNLDVEPYDDNDEWTSESSSTSDLLPPGFESSSKKTTTPSGDQNSASTSGTRKTTSILPIRTLYSQLKQHRLRAAMKKQPKPKVYGPSPWKPIEKDPPKPAGPELPPVSSSMDTVPAEPPKPKKKIKKKSDVLTPEFLAELEKKRLEHEEDMKKKTERLEKLKATRQSVTNRKNDMEEDVKKKMELGLFDRHRSGKESKISSGGIILDFGSGSDEDALTVDASHERRVDAGADEGYLLVVPDERKEEEVTETIDDILGTGSNMDKFPSFTVSVRASTGGEVVRSVMESRDDEMDRRKERYGRYEETEKRSPRKYRYEDYDRDRYRRNDDRLRHDRYDMHHKSYHSRRTPPSRRSERSRSPRRYSTEREKRRPSGEHFQERDQRPVSEKQEPKSQPPVPAPPTEADEAFQRQAELLELELRAKAIRSLMKVQDEQKEEEII